MLAPPFPFLQPSFRVFCNLFLQLVAKRLLFDFTSLGRIDRLSFFAWSIWWVCTYHWAWWWIRSVVVIVRKCDHFYLSWLWLPIPIEWWWSNITPMVLVLLVVVGRDRLRLFFMQQALANGNVWVGDGVSTFLWYAKSNHRLDRERYLYYARGSFLTSRVVGLLLLQESSMFLQRVEPRVLSSWSSSSSPSRALGRLLFGASPEFILLGVLGCNPNSLVPFPTVVFRSIGKYSKEGYPFHLVRTGLDKLRVGSIEQGAFARKCIWRGGGNSVLVGVFFSRNRGDGLPIKSEFSP